MGVKWMSLSIKGKEILKDSNYNLFRKAFIDSIMQRISLEGQVGSDIRSIISKTLEEEKFDIIVDKLLQNIAKKTNLSKEESIKAIPILLEEDVAGEISKNLPGQIREEKVVGKKTKEDEIYNKGKANKLWEAINFKHLIGTKVSLIDDIFLLLKRSKAIRYALLSGLSFLIISAIIFKSIYKALIVALTLTNIPGNSAIIMIANVLGGLGGFLIFFVSLTFIFEYIFHLERSNRQVQDMARNYFTKGK